MKISRKAGIRKLLVFLLAIFTITATLASFALAENDGDSMVVHQGETLYYNDEGARVGSDAEWAVKMSKIAVGTGVENEFEITLDVTVRDPSVIEERKQPIPVDIVLVFDLSASMDGGTSLWKALKNASNAFIDNIFAEVNGVKPDVRLSIVGYGGMHYPNMTGDYSVGQYMVIHDWTTDASAAKESYIHHDTTESMRRASGREIGMNTNSQAGFYLADVMLGTFTSPSGARPAAGELQYVVYMSDGEANAHYYVSSAYPPVDNYVTLPQKEEIARAFHNNMPVTVTAENAAIAQAGVLKNNHPDAQLYTVGLSEGNSKVLKTGEGNNIYSDRYFYSTDLTVGSIYLEISEIIKLHTAPWLVVDSMGAHVNFGSVTTGNDAYVSYADGVLNWHIQTEAIANNQTMKTFTAKYTVTLDMSNTNVWDNGAPNPTNGDTTLQFNVFRDEVFQKQKVVHFDVPVVKANVYNYTFEYYDDGILRPGATVTEKRAAGDVLYLDFDGAGDSRDKALANYTLFDVTINGESVSTALTDTIATGSETDGAIVRYYYKSGYALTINYFDADDPGNALAAPHYDLYSVNFNYSIASPVITGYALVQEAQATIAGIKKAEDESFNVYYRKIPYTATYIFSGESPDGASPPVDSGKYHWGDSIAVKPAPSAAGWTFNGWTAEGSQVGAEYGPVIGNVEFIGTWARNQYLLDVVYVFAGEDDYQDFIGQMEAAIDANAYLAEMQSVIGTFYDSYGSADGALFNNVFVFQPPALRYYGDTYSYTAGSGIPGFKSGGTVSGSISGDKTVVFELHNDLFTVTVYHNKLNKGGSYGIADTDVLYVRGGDIYSVEAKDYDGFYIGDGSAIGTYTMENSYPVYDIFYDPYMYDVDFGFVTEDNPGAPAPNAQTGIWHGDSARDPMVTPPAGWEFDGWYTDASLSEPFGFETPVTENITLYGGWSRVAYTVRFAIDFAPGGAAGTEIGGETIPAAPDDQTVEFEDTAADPGYTPVMVSNVGAVYIFDGWYTEPSLTNAYNFDAIVTRNITLYGKWTKTANDYPYTIEHYLDGVLFATLNGMSNLPYGTEISNATATNYAMGGPGLAVYFQAGDLYLHIGFDSATGCMITEMAANNVIRVYYVTRTYSLTVNYLYGDTYEEGLSGSQVFPQYVDQEIPYGAQFSVDAPGIAEGYTAQESTVEWHNNAAMTNPEGLVNVAGTMPGQDITLTIWYNADERDDGNTDPPPKPQPPSAIYTVTVEHVSDEPDGTQRVLMREIHPGLYFFGSHYTTSPDSFNGYEPAGWDSATDPVSGTVTRDMFVRYLYIPIENTDEITETTITPPDVPRGNDPGASDPEIAFDTAIEGPGVPRPSASDPANLDVEPDITLENPDVPLGVLPDTGLLSIHGALLMAGAALVATGVIITARQHFPAKKQKKN